MARAHSKSEGKNTGAFFVATLVLWFVSVLFESLFNGRTELLAVVGGCFFYQIANCLIRFSISRDPLFVNTSVSLLHSSVTSVSGIPQLLVAVLSGHCCSYLLHLRRPSSPVQLKASTPPPVLSNSSFSGCQFDFSALFSRHCNTQSCDLNTHSGDFSVIIIMINQWIAKGPDKMFEHSQLFSATWPGAYTALCFSSGYFAYDQWDMLHYRLYSGLIPSILVHHLILLVCFTLALFRNVTINYLILTLICERAAMECSKTLVWNKICGFVSVFPRNSRKMEACESSKQDGHGEGNINWIQIQELLKNRLILEDDFTWRLPTNRHQHGLREELKYIGGVDLSFSKENPCIACGALVIVDLNNDLKVVYEDFSVVKLQIPYIPGFLAFREAPVLLMLLEKMKSESHPFFPQVLMIDGNGVLHPQGFGLACHLGVQINLPTIGIGKNLHHVDGLAQSGWKHSLGAEKNCTRDLVPLIGQSGRTWGAAMRSTRGSLKPIFISIGHRISLDTAIEVVKMTCKHRVPEPIRQADIRSRAFLQKHSEPDIMQIVGKQEMIKARVSICN